MKTLGLVIAVALAQAPSSLADAQSIAAGDTAALRRALEVDPFAIAPYRLLAVNLRPADRRKLAEEIARGARFSDLVLAARLQLDAGQIDEARARVRQAAVALPTDVRQLDAFCQLAMSAGAHAEMAVAAHRTLDKNRTPQRLVVAAIAELRQGHRKEGLALLAEVRSKDPSGAAADGMIDALLGQHMFAESAELLRAELSYATGAPNAAKWRRLADLDRQLDRPADASDALLHALDAESSSIGRRAVAQGVLRLHRERKTLPELVRTLKDASSSPRLVLRGDVETELGRGAAASSSYEAAAKADPNDPDPPLRLAAGAKTPADRAARYAMLVAAHPGELKYALDLADLRFASKDDAGGKKALHDAAMRFAAAPSAQDQIARRLSEHHDLKGALQCRRRAAELDARNAEYALALGEAYRALDMRNEAVSAYGDSISRGENSRSAYDRALDALERAGYDAEADVRYVEARRRWPADLALVRRQAAALERSQDYKRALELWNDMAKKTTRLFEREQAEYHIHRLEQDAAMAGSKER